MINIITHMYIYIYIYIKDEINLFYLLSMMDLQIYIIWLHTQIFIQYKINPPSPPPPPVHIIFNSSHEDTHYLSITRIHTHIYIYIYYIFPIRHSKVIISCYIYLIYFSLLVTCFFFSVLQKCSKVFKINTKLDCLVACDCKCIPWPPNVYAPPAPFRYSLLF